MVKAGGGAPVAVFLLAPAGDGNEQQVLSSGHLAEPSGDLVAVHSRHSNIENDHLGPKNSGFLERWRAAIGGADLLVGKPKQHGERVRGVHVVVHHEDAM